MLANFDLLCEGKYSELMREQGAGSEVLTFVWMAVQLGGLVGACGALLVVFGWFSGRRRGRALTKPKNRSATRRI